MNKTQILTILILTTMTTASGNLLSSETHCKNGTDPYCLTCGSQEDQIGCLLCASSYIDSETKTCKVPTTTIDHCGTYDSSSKKCKECVKGFFVSSDGFCVKHNLKGCVDPLDQDKCRECESFMLDDDHKCDLEKNCSIVGCSTCKMENGKEVCVNCKDDYIFSLDDAQGHKCEIITQETEGCLGMKNGECVGCQFGYYVVSKYGEKAKCERSPAYEFEFVLNWVISLVLLSLTYTF